MRRRKTIFISLLIATCAVCVSAAFAACGGKDGTKARYGAGEEGFYYYDGADSTRYMLSLQSGTYMLTANGDAAYSGSYDFDEEKEEISFTGDADFTAAVGENALSLDMGDSGYTFKAYRYFDVTYLDGDGNTVATESVLNGQSAEALDIGKDGYWFIGWYEDNTNSSEFAFDTSIAGDTTVYGWYIEKDPQATDYMVTLNYGDGVTETEETMNGAVWALPASHEGVDILGWWVSATNKGGELTYRYVSGDPLSSDTILFAVYASDTVMGASVTKEGITWENRSAGANVAVTIYDSDGTQVFSGTTSSSTPVYSPSALSSLETGIYTVTVSAGSAEDTLIYVVNGLPRVSASSVGIVVNGDGRVLTFAPVDGAARYEITISDGTKTVTEDLGSRTYYNLSGWEMTETGLTITVTAFADGYVSSVSDEYNYLLRLDKVALEMSGDDVVWNRVESALEYLVTVYGENGEVLESIYTTETSYSLKYCDAGTYTISVKPVTDGYWSEETFIYGQAKSTIAAPIITDITDYTITWEPVDGAGSYVVTINGTTYTVTEGTTLAFSEYGVPETADSYEIAVMTVAEEGLDSSYSDTVTATNGGFRSSVRYDKNTVYWDYDVSATGYVVSVNGEDTEIEKGNSAEITLNRAGNNEITVTAYGANGSLGQAEIDVYAYTVTLDPNGAALDGASVLYVAQGDTLNLGTVTKDHADFIGWYTQADYTMGQSDIYEGKGSEVISGSVFTGSRSMYLYAYWTYEYMTLTLDVGSGTLTDESGNEIFSVKVKYGSSSYSLPVPEASSAEYDFTGWYTAAGERYTGGDGGSLLECTEDSALCARYSAVRKFTSATYGGASVYAVSAGADIDDIEELTIPETYDGKYLVLNSGAFEDCTTLRVINIPDTVRFVSVANGGFRSGTGAFAGCGALEAVNVYATEDAPEIYYYSDAGVLFHKTDEGCVEILYYPQGRGENEYAIPTEVFNENETDERGNSVAMKVTSVPSQVFRDKGIEKLTVPYTVTYVSGSVFYSDSTLKEVVFEEGGSDALTIADYAFQRCFSLESVTFPSRYTDFNGKMFDMCGNLTDVYIEGGGAYESVEGLLISSDGTTVVYFPCGRGGDVVTETLTDGAVTRIGDYAFSGNTKITAITVSPQITYIGEGAFENCTAVKTLTFDEGYGALTIRTRAFYGCSGVTSLRLPSNLTVLENDAFGGCAKLSYVYFDSFEGATEGSLSFSAGAFGATNYITTLEFGPNVPEMDFENIFGSYNIDTITIDPGNGNYLTYDGAVYDKSGETIRYYPLGKKGEYTLYEGCTTIGEDVFADRVNLTKITIGANVTQIATGAFYGCTYLTAIDVDDGNQRYASVDGVLYEKKEGSPATLLYCPIACAEDTLTVPGTVTSVSSYAFRDNAAVKTVTFEAESSFTLNTYAFYYASALETVNLPSCIKSIPAYAFYRCTALLGDLSEGGTMKLPEGITSIGNYAFYFCQSFACTIPSTVSSIGQNAFDYCWDSAAASAEIVFADTENTASSLTIGTYAFGYTKYATGVTIPKNLTSAGTYAFTSLGSELDGGAGVQFADGAELTAISDYMFYNAALTGAEIPEGVTSVGKQSFRNTQLMASVSIPSTVTAIGDDAFYSSGVADVMLAADSALETIGSGAFRDSAVTSFTIPSTVTSIGTGAFRGCSALADCSFADGTTITELPVNMFMACSSLTSFEIPECVTVINTYAFSQCSSLASVTIPAGVTKIDTEAFSSCTSLETVELKSGTKIESFGNYAFSGCTSLKSFSFPDNDAASLALGGNLFNGCTLESLYLSYNITSLGTALGGCRGVGTLTVSENNPSYEADANGKILYSKDKKEIVYVFGSFDTVTIPEYVETIDAYAFDAQSSLKTVTIPAGVTTIGNYAFRNCTALEEVIFEEGSGVVKGSLGTYMFYGCTALESVSLPSGLTRVPNYTFYNCLSLESIELPSSVTQIGSSAFYQSGIKTLDMTNITSVGASAFYGCSSLENVTFSGKLSSLGSDVFSMCSSLKIDTLPDGLTSIPADAFWRCNSMETFTVPSTVTTIGASAFYACVSLTEVIIPEGVTEIGSSAFSGCESLVKCDLPSSIVTIGSSAFGSTAITSAVVPYGFTSVPSSVFGYCENLTEVTIPDTVTSIGSSAFRGCTVLEKIYVGTYVTEIGANAFDGCTSLKEITFGNCLESVGNYAFRECTSLVTMEFNTVMTKISDYEFYGCTSLETVTIDKGVTEIGDYAFYGCTSLEYLLIPSSVSSVGTGAFGGLTCPVYAESSANYVATNWGSWNDNFAGTIYHYSDSEPDFNAAGDSYDGRYWHYDGEGNITVWEYSPDVYVVEGNACYIGYNGSLGVIVGIYVYDSVSGEYTSVAFTQSGPETGAACVLVFGDGSAYSVTLESETMSAVMTAIVS